MDALSPVRLHHDSAEVPEVLRLIRSTFAYMDGRIDPPTSMHRLSEDDIRRTCQTGEVWTIGAPPQACVFLTPMENVLYLGKLAVSPSHRGAGLARRLVQTAEERARALGRTALELEVRIELVENQAAFARMGFETTAEGAHDGYDRPTFVIMRKTF